MQVMSEINHTTADSLNTSIPWSNSLYALCCLLVLILLTTFIRKFFGFKPGYQKLPPGPKGWPLVGCLFQFKRYFIWGFEDLEREYGPIFTLQLVSTPMIYITDADIIHEAFVEKGSIFASRPYGGASTEFLSSNYRTVSMASYGPVWRTLRKNFVSGIMSSFRSSNFSHVREEVVEGLLRRSRNEAAQNCGIVQVRQIIRYGIFDLLLWLCFGKRAKECEVLDVAQLTKQILVRSRTGIDEFIPWLGFILPKRTKERQQLRQRQVNALLPFIKEAQRLHRDGNLLGGSYIDSLLALDLEGKMLSDDELVALCTEFLNAGSDTTATALEWAIASIISHPHVQAQIQSELERAVGNRAVKEEDIDNLPYLEAVVKETLRRHPPGYLTLPHAVSQPCKLQGYDIPLNANVFACLSSISNNPTIWDDPTEFKPERFLSSDVDITGSKKITMIPFGTGRRICPGMELAMLHLNYILARLIQSFEWSATAPDETIDLTPTFEFTVVMKSPLKAFIMER